MLLPGCAARTAETPPAVIAVPVRDTPPAVLLICPTRPDAFPVDAEATIPPAVRTAMIGLAHGYAAARDQLGRLIAWNSGMACEDGQTP